MDDAALQEIRGLPSKLEGPTKSSGVIEKVNQRRKDRLEEILKSVSANVGYINDGIDEQIYQLTKELKYYLVNTRAIIQNIIDERIKKFIIKPSKLTEQKFADVSDLVWKINDSRISQISVFYNNVTRMEEFRTAKFKIVYKDAYRRILQNYYRIPYDLEEYFQMEVLKVNQITLSNYNCYCELQNHLKQELCNEIRLWMLELEEFKQKWFEIYYPKSDKSKSGSEVLKVTIDPIEQKSNASSYNCAAKWAKDLQISVDRLDSTAKNMVVLYKSAILKIFHRFLKELSSVTVDLEINPPTVLDSTLLETLQDLSQDPDCEVEELQVLWESVVEYMKTSIQSTYVFLNIVSHLWGDHFHRIDEAQTLVLKDIQKHIDKHNKSTQISEEQMNTTIDKLRQGASKEELDQHLKVVTKILDSIHKMQINQNKEELKIVEKYYRLVDLEIGVLLAELQRFLHENVQVATKVDNPKFEAKHLLIPRMLTTSRYQVEAVYNWMFGLWEAIKVYLTHCREELHIEAQQWMSSIAEKIDKRLEIRLAVHKPRYERIRVEIYERRRQELEKHQQNLDNFEQAVEEALRTKKEEIASLSLESDTVIKDYKSIAMDLETKLKDSKSSWEIDSLLRNLNNSKQHSQEQIKKICEKIHGKCEDIKPELEKLKLKFWKSVRLFCDEGNYSNAEVKKFKKKVLSIEISVPKKILQILNQTEKGILKKSENLDRELTNFADKTKVYKEEFQLNENTIEKLKKLGHKIRQEVCEFKFKNKRLFNGIQQFVRFCRAQMNNPEMMSEIEEGFIETEKDCLDLHLSFLDDKTEGYCYYKALQDLISNVFREVEDLAKAFYQSHPVIKSSNRVQPDLENFIKEITSKLETYKWQCELNWFESIQAFLGQILLLLNLLKDFHDNFVNEHLNKYCIHFEDTCRDVLQKLAKQRLQIKRKFNNLLNNFSKKPDAVLKTFEDDMAALHLQCVQSLNSFIDEQVEYIRVSYREIRDEISTIQSATEKLSEKHLIHIFKILINKFEDQLNGVKDLKGICERNEIELGPSLSKETFSSASETHTVIEILKALSSNLGINKSTLDSIVGGLQISLDDGAICIKKKLDYLRRNKEDTMRELESSRDLSDRLYGEQLVAFTIKPEKL